MNQNLSIINRTISLSLLELLRTEGLIDDDTTIGSDGEDGLSIRWPGSRMFCDVSDGEIIISIVPLNYQSYLNVENYMFKSDELSTVCAFINKNLIK